jgi:hypothetical protein
MGSPNAQTAKPEAILTAPTMPSVSARMFAASSSVFAITMASS